MTPISLTLTGFKGIRDGLGRETVTIDFQELTHGAELVAITGGNGRGKTTILDNMTPYPVMPSKAGADGLGTFSYYEEVYLPENLKEFTWELDDARYRCSLVIRDNGRRKTEAYLLQQHEHDWRPVRLSDGTISDGRMETYLKCVETIAGNCATFLTTAFSAQQRRQLAGYRNAEIKALLADLLGLGRVRSHGEQALETLRLLRSGLLSLRHARAIHQTEYDKFSGKLASFGDAQKQADSARQNKRIATERRDACRDNVTALTSQRDLHGPHEARRTQLQLERRHAIAHAEAIRHQQAQQERSARDALERQGQRIAQRRSQNEIHIAALRAQVTSLQRIIHSGRHVDRAVNRVRILEPLLARRTHVLETCTLDAMRQNQLQAELALKESALAGIEREAGQAILAEQDLRRRFGLASEVPCAGMALQQQCKLLGDARAAKPLIPSALASIARLDTARSALCSDIATMLAEIGAGASVDDALKAAKAKRCRSEARLSWERQLAGRQADITQAQASLAAADEQLAILHAAAPDEKASERAEEAALRNQLEAILRQAEQERKHGEAEIARIDQLLLDLPPAFDDAALARAISAKAQSEAFLTSAEQAHEIALAAVQHQTAAAHGLQECAQQLARMDAHIGQVESDIARWALFAKCMGNDGIIALAIDDAGPELSLRTNQLLLACYGSRFTVAIKTQIENAKGDIKEGFEITVHDAWRNASKNVAKMSGGERIWINECLTRAMALYLAEASGRRSSTLFSDEADGAFDAQHKRQFMAMKREVLRIGGYAQEYFISHTPELSAMADVVIDLDQYALADSAAVS